MSPLRKQRDPPLILFNLLKYIIISIVDGGGFSMKNSGIARNYGSVLKAVATGSAFLLAGASTAFAAGIQVIPDSSVIIQVVNFIFLIWVLNIILYKPIRKIVAERKDKVEGLEGSIDNLSQDALEKDQAYGAGIKDARTKGLAEKDAIVQTAEEDEKKVVEEIMAKAQADLAEIREKIVSDTEVVRAALQKEVDTFAEDIGQKILGRTV
jgi:F-type H+-transporting ATPase subunit b